MNKSVSRAVGKALAAKVASWRGPSGGDINEAYAVRLDDGREVFVKTNARAPADMFGAEARGLAWLAEADALRVPRVLAVDESFLALELIESAAPARDHDERFGRGLAALHRYGAATFGLDHDNYIGRLPQGNAPADDWVAFYRDRRLVPQLDMAEGAGHIVGAERRRYDGLLDNLASFVGPTDPPARLHGDLWGGNAHVDGAGGPCILDPAAYAGSREVDLAMMQLFGGFSARVFDAYLESHPLDAEWRGRVPLYQLYFLLVHVNLFGGSYVGSARNALAALKAPGA